MIRTSSVRSAYAGVALLALMFASARVGAQQGAPAKVPVPVAVAALGPMSMGAPKFFDAQLPTNWPADLVPAGARIIGGSILGDSSMILVRSGVFELAGEADPDTVLSQLFSRAGYAATPRPTPVAEEGFISSDPTGLQADWQTPLCKGGVSVMRVQVDSSARSRVRAVILIEGEAGRQTCSAMRMASHSRHFPVNVPALEPPAGATQMQGASGWGNGEGHTTARVQTAMSADSLLAHYASRLVAAGWRADGLASATQDVGVQRFTFRHGKEDWKGTLFVLRDGDWSKVELEVARRE